MADLSWIIFLTLAILVTCLFQPLTIVHSPSRVYFTTVTSFYNQISERLRSHTVKSVCLLSKHHLILIINFGHMIPVFVRGCKIISGQEGC